MPNAQHDFGSRFPEKIAKDPEASKAIDAVFIFRITGDDGGTWTLNLKDQPGVHDGESEGADCTFELSAADWESLSDNPSSAMQLYFSQRLKVSGNVMLATKLQQFLA